jgi:hypothetical protein
VIDDELRDLGPRGLAPDRHQALRDQLLATIADPSQDRQDLLDEPATTSPPSPSRRWRAVALAAAAVIVVVAIGAGILANGSQPDVATTTGATTAPAPLDDRPVLAAEQVPCVMSTPERSRTVELTDTALATPIDEATIVAACQGAVADLQVGGTPSPPALCRDPAATLPTAVVVHVGVTCETNGYVPMGATDLATLNDLRDLEAALWAIEGDCPTATDLLTWSRDQVAATDLPVTVAEPSPALGTSTCTQPAVDWSAGTITVAPQAGG